MDEIRPHTTTDHDACTSTVAEIGGVVVSAVKKKSTGGRVYNKRHHCWYCFKSCSKIARHLQQKHSNEREVAEALKFPKGSTKRRMHLDLIRNTQ